MYDMMSIFIEYLLICIVIMSIFMYLYNVNIVNTCWYVWYNVNIHWLFIDMYYM